MVKTYTGDLYGTLGVSQTATVEEIRTAYRKLARTKHPDKNPGNEQATAEFQLVRMPGAVRFFATPVNCA